MHSGVCYFIILVLVSFLLVITLYDPTGSLYKIDVYAGKAQYYKFLSCAWCSMNVKGQCLGKQLLLSGYIMCSALNYCIHMIV